jgi:hypothetical protein
MKCANCKKVLIGTIITLVFLWIIYSYIPNGKELLTLFLNSSGFAGAAAIIGVFYSNGQKEKRAIEEIKHEPESVASINGVHKIIKTMKEEALSPFKRYKFRQFILPVPQTVEQAKKNLETDMMLGTSGTKESLADRGIDNDFIDLDLMDKFFQENGGKDNFGISYQKGLKLPESIYMLSYKNIYTYSKKSKAVFIKEEVRQSDNTFNLWVFCTKNHGITPYQ